MPEGFPTELISIILYYIYIYIRAHNNVSIIAFGRFPIKLTTGNLINVRFSFFCSPPVHNIARIRFSRSRSNEFIYTICMSEVEHRIETSEYSDSLTRQNGRIEENVTSRIRRERIKWKQTTGILCGKNVIWNKRKIL